MPFKLSYDKITTSFEFAAKLNWTRQFEKLESHLEAAIDQ